jgi:hypothetical protein
MVRSNWRDPRGTRHVKPSGSGKLRRQRFTGTHKLMKRSDREALCRKLGG